MPPLKLIFYLLVFIFALARLVSTGDEWYALGMVIFGALLYLELAAIVR